MTIAITLSNMNFYEKVRYLREKEGLTQAGLAERVRSYQSRIWSLENPTDKGARKVEPSLVFKISEYFHIPVRWLLDDRLGVEDLSEIRSDYQDLTEVERQIIANARIIGHKVAMARLLGVKGDATPTKQLSFSEIEAEAEPKPVAPHQQAKTLKTDVIPRRKAAEPKSAEGDAGEAEEKGKATPKTKKPRSPK